MLTISNPDILGDFVNRDDYTPDLVVLEKPESFIFSAPENFRDKIREWKSFELSLYTAGATIIGATILSSLINR